MRVLEILGPTKITILVLAVLILFVPVFYVYYEPDRTNYLPGEEQTFQVKTQSYSGTVLEYAFHTDGSIDLLWGILGRNYIQNLIGPVLVLVYYFLAAGINWGWQRVRSKSK